RRPSKLRLCPTEYLGTGHGYYEFLVFLFFPAGSRRFAAAFGLLLRLRLFHSLLGFGGTLGADFGALLAVFFDHPLCSQQFDERLFGAITLLPAGAHDPQIAALAVPEAGREFEQLVHSFAGHEIGAGLTARRQIPAL